MNLSAVTGAVARIRDCAGSSLKSRLYTSRGPELFCVPMGMRLRVSVNKCSCEGDLCNTGEFHTTNVSASYLL